MRLVCTNYGYTTPTDNPWHVHEFWEVFVVLDGNATLFIEDSAIKLHRGSIVLEPPGYRHRVQGEDLVLLVWFLLDPFQSPSKEEIPVFQDEENRFCLLSRMLYEVTIRQGANYRKIQNALINTMYEILVSWSQSDSENALFEGLIREMIFHVPDPAYDPSEYIKQSGYCADHFRRRFKKIAGRTPTDYLLHLRIEHAKSMLDMHHSYSISIKEVAAKSGFRDPFYFSSMFKKITGMSPSGYRNWCGSRGGLARISSPVPPGEEGEEES